MRILLFSILCIVVAEVSSKKALLFNLETRTLADPYLKNGDKKCSPYLTACPAFTPQERQFNKNMSIGKQSLFSRLICVKEEYLRNMKTDICENRIKPTMLYDTEDDYYEIGYELYFEDDKINMTDKTYHRYKRVNTINPKDYEILNESIPSSDGFVTRYENEKNVKFSFSDGNRSLVFYWIEVLSIESTNNQKCATLRNDFIESRKFEHLLDKCSNYRSDDDELYSKENQKKSLRGILVPKALYEGNPDMECGQPYGCLEKSQIVPLWYFDSRSARLASCSYMNLIPVWKSIVEQLRKVDLYILAIIQNLVRVDVIHFGTIGTLRMKTPATFSNVFKKRRKMYLSDSVIRHKKVAIPKIIYRIIRITSHRDEDPGVAAVIIHNDPSADPNVDKICDDTDHRPVTGWSKIENNDTRTGLTYVCPVTENVNDKLGVYDHDDPTLYEIFPLDLDAIPYGFSGHCDYSDETDNIDRDFEKILEKYKRV